MRSVFDLSQQLLIRYSEKKDNPRQPRLFHNDEIKNQGFLWKLSFRSGLPESKRRIAQCCCCRI